MRLVCRCSGWLVREPRAKGKVHSPRKGASRIIRPLLRIISSVFFEELRRRAVRLSRRDAPLQRHQFSREDERSVGERRDERKMRPVAAAREEGSLRERRPRRAQLLFERGERGGELAVLADQRVSPSRGALESSLDSEQRAQPLLLLPVVKNSALQLVRYPQELL